MTQFNLTPSSTILLIRNDLTGYESSLKRPLMHILMVMEKIVNAMSLTSHANHPTQYVILQDNIFFNEGKNNIMNWVNWVTNNI